MEQYIGVIAAFLSAVAAVAAAIAAWRGPMEAAKLAETLRSTSEAGAERRRMKLWVFTTLMQERAHLYTADAVRAFNLIDTTFSDSKAVRDAWADVFSSFDSNAGVPSHARDERMKTLLKYMAKELNLSSSLRSDDLSRVYFPNALAEERLLQNMQRNAAIQSLRGQAPAANTSPSAAYNPTTPYPPRPE